jgi:hypothetical protein
MEYFKCEECKRNNGGQCFSMVQIGYEPELCFVSISGLSNWQPINKEQFLKEIG